jgi:hypothetical protein
MLVESRSVKQQYFLGARSYFQELADDISADLADTPAWAVVRAQTSPATEIFRNGSPAPGINKPIYR